MLLDLRWQYEEIDDSLVGVDVALTSAEADLTVEVNLVGATVAQTLAEGVLTQAFVSSGFSGGAKGHVIIMPRRVALGGRASAHSAASAALTVETEIDLSGAAVAVSGALAVVSCRSDEPDILLLVQAGLLEFDEAVILLAA